jgi:hypothetical protein
MGLPIKVLIVEDEPDLLDLTKEFLEITGGFRITPPLRAGKRRYKRCPQGPSMR